MTKESQMSSEQMRAQMLELADAGTRHGTRLTAQLDKADWRPSRAHIEQARNSIVKLAAQLRLAAQSAAPVGEPVAWTNEAQLEYLRDRNWSEVPMAMWAKPIGAADIPLYRAAPPPSTPQVREAKLLTLLAIINAAGGEVGCSDHPNSWLNYFCDDFHPTDTFNQAVDAKFLRVHHDDRFDASAAYLTDAGRAALAKPGDS